MTTNDDQYRYPNRVATYGVIASLSLLVTALLAVAVSATAMAWMG